MQIYQASLHYTLVSLGSDDPLRTAPAFAEFMTGAFADCLEVESLWLISMNPTGRAIARTLLRTGPCAAVMTSARDIFRAALHVDAHAIAVVRGEPSGSVQLTPTDRRMQKEYATAGEYLNIRFLDYLVLSTREYLPKPLFDSWRHPAD